MANAKVVVLSLICVILAVGCIGSVMLLTQKEVEVNLKAEELVEIENEKSTLETQLSGLLSDKSSLEVQVLGLESETTELSDDVSDLESQVSGLETEVTTLELEVIQNYDLGYSEGESEGYETGYGEGYSVAIDYMTENGYSIRNPTYAEALAFISSDRTDRNVYTDDYVCYDFTADFNYNAEQQGYRCGFVYITFSESAHAIACFETIDNGLIYVEPQTDEVVTLQVGHVYNGDVVQSLGIIW